MSLMVRHVQISLVRILSCGLPVEQRHEFKEQLEEKLVHAP